MDLALVEEEGGVAEGTVVTESAVKLPEMGVLAVLMAQQGLLVAALVAAVAAGVEWGGCARVVLGSHVLLKLILPLARKGTHLTHEGLSLVAQFVAAQLISPMAAVRALVALVSGKKDKAESITINPNSLQSLTKYYRPGSALCAACEPSDLTCFPPSCEVGISTL